MKKDDKFQQVGCWENRTERLKVPHGWLIKTRSPDDAISICFYADPNHLWEEIK